MTGWTFIKGTTRAVLCIGGLAIKFARSADGARGNRFEADLYRRSDPERRKLLCTPLWCSPNGAVFMMRRARPMTEGDFRQHVIGAGLYWAWDHRGPDDDDIPFEPQAEDWGWLDDRPVAVDYAHQ
jgi:hypothetical protein